MIIYEEVLKRYHKYSHSGIIGEIPMTSNKSTENSNIPFNNTKEDNIEGILDLCSKPCIVTEKPIEPPTPEKPVFLLQFLKLIKPFWYSKNKSTIRKWAAALVILTVLQIGMSVITVEWTAALFSALELHSMSAFLEQIAALGVILVSSMTLTASHMKVKRNIQIALRTWLTNDVIGKWFKDSKQYKISLNQNSDNDNPDGRISEDIRSSCDTFIELWHSFFLAVLTLGSFTGMLWVLSGVLTLNLGFMTLNVYGYLVWLGIIYTIVASYIGLKAGKPLTVTTNNMINMEQNFRSKLIDVRENCGKIALTKSEEQTEKECKNLFSEIKELYNKQTGSWINIMLFNSGRDTVNMAFPFLITAPMYIINKISLGTLMQSVQAFQQFTGALSWLPNNMAGIAMWRASVERVLSLVKSLDKMDN